MSNDVYTMLLDSLRTGQSILFTGAGFNSGINNINGIAFPFADELKDIMVNSFSGLTGFEQSNIEVIAEKIVDDNQTHDFIELLKKTFTISKVGDYPQANISKINWKRVYTTNYDDVMEYFIQKDGKTATPITLSDRVSDNYYSNMVIHLNGYIDRLTPRTINTEFKLTSSSYTRSSLFIEQGDWEKFFRNDLITASSIVFVGVSFEYDLDIRRILTNVGDLKDKIFFIERNGLPKSDKYIKSKFGNVIDIGVEKFCNDLGRLNLTEIPDKAITYESFEHITTNYKHYIKSTSELSRQLLNFGKLEHDVLKSNFDGNDYTIIRSKELDIYNEIKNEKYLCHVVLSNMGNGKTILMERLAVLLSKDFNVYFLRTERNNINLEVESIVKSKGKKVILVEDYTYFLETIGLFKMYINSEFNDIIFIFSSRTFLNSSMTFHLNKYLDIQLEKVVEYNIDYLDKDDNANLISLLDYSNYFEQYRNERITDKIKTIKKKYKSEFRNILLDLVKSHKFVTEVKEIYSKISESSIAKDIVLASSICNVVALKLSNDDLLLSLDTPYLDSALKNDQYLNLFIDLSTNSSYSKSSLFSKFIIEKCSNYEDVKSVITKMVINAENCYDIKTKKRIRKILISTSNVSQIIRSFTNNYETDMTDFYNTIKHLDFYINNPYFWIQYAMACMDIKQFDRAMDNLKIAEDLFEKIKRRHYDYDDSYQIEIQKERCNLESVLYYGECDKPFELINSSYTIFKRLLQHNDTQKHLILKHMMLYGDIVSVFLNSFTIEQLNTVYGKIDETCNMLRSAGFKAGKYNSNYSYTHYIEKLELMKTNILKSIAILDNL